MKYVFHDRKEMDLKFKFSYFLSIDNRLNMISKSMFSNDWIYSYLILSSHHLRTLVAMTSGKVPDQLNTLNVVCTHTNGRRQCREQHNKLIKRDISSWSSLVCKYPFKSSFRWKSQEISWTPFHSSIHKKVSTFRWCFDIWHVQRFLQKILSLWLIQLIKITFFQSKPSPPSNHLCESISDQMNAFSGCTCY